MPWLRRNPFVGLRSDGLLLADSVRKLQCNIWSLLLRTNWILLGSILKSFCKSCSNLRLARSPSVGPTVSFDKKRQRNDDAVGHRSLRCRPAHQQRRSRETTGTGQDKTGSKKVVAFKKAIIAAGSQAVRLPFMPDDPRVVDSTGALALQGVPQKMLIVGGGIIGLEMGTVYSTLGARLDVVEMMDGLMQGADRDLVKVWEKMNKHRFDNILLKTKTVGAQATPEGIQVQFEGLDGTKSEGTYDLVLQAVGRTPNGKKIAADKAGVSVTDRGFINVDIQMRTNVPHIFAIGDIVGQPMLAHKAVHEAHVAAEVIVACPHGAIHLEC